MTPDAVLRCIAKLEKVSLPEAKLAGELGIDAKDAGALAEMEVNLDTLKDAGDVCRWILKGKAVVTLSSVAAYRFRLKLNPSSTKWVAHGSREGADRNKARTTVDGAKVMCESDMTEEPPGELDNIVDARWDIEDDPEPHRARALAEEAILGLMRPTLSLVGIVPWTAENWERAPDAHVCDPMDDPRRVPEPGEVLPRRRSSPAKLRNAPRGPCPVCGGRPLRPMIALVMRKEGNNRAARPPEIVEGVEFCCRCNRHAQDAKWPKVYRISDPETNGKVIES